MKIPLNAQELTCFYTWKGEDGIVRTKIKPGSDVSINEAKENSEAVNALFTGNKFPLMIDARGIRSMSREARNQFTTKGRETHARAFAIIIDSSLSKVIGNFFLGINRPAVPTRLFDNETEAKTWLRTLL